MTPRVLFPKTGFTTEDLGATYEQLAPVLLPHLRDRPVTLKRYPDDVQGEAFWEKDLPSFAPKWVKSFPVPRKHEPGLIRYINISDTGSSAGLPPSAASRSTRSCIAIRT
jgi:bifunctional non-homologous end joining protein LigD